jgi:L-fuconolactonase
MVTETENFVFSDEVFTPFMDHVFASFGANRLLFGSDWPVCLLAADYNKVFALINDYLELHSAKTKAQVLGINATKIYNL